MQASSLSISSGQPIMSTSAAGGAPSSSAGANQLLGIGAVRVASTAVTNVMRPVISTPLPITSKPRDGGPSSSPHPPERKSLTPQQQPQLLIGPGAGGGAAATGGGYYPSSPNPVGAGMGQGGVVTNLVLPGVLPAQSAVQLITPSPQPQPSHQQALPSNVVSAPHSQTNGPLPLLQPQFLPASSLAPPVGKAITQVQYILPTLPANPKSPPQHLSQPTGIFNLPTAPLTQVANGKHQGMGVPPAGYTSSPALGVVSPGTRGERSSRTNIQKFCFHLMRCSLPLSVPLLSHQFKLSLRSCRVKCLFPCQQYGLQQPLPHSFLLWLRLFLSRMVPSLEARSEGIFNFFLLNIICLCCWRQT